MIKVTDELRQLYYRTYIADHAWYSDTYLHYKKLLARVGFRIDECYFSGFWSQGDGACFTGRIENFDRFITFMAGADAYPVWRIAARQGNVIFKVLHSGRYCHAHTATPGLESWSLRWPSADEFGKAMAAAWDAALDAESLQFETDCITYLRRWMDRMYCDLEKEYESITSDEQILEWAADYGVNELTEDAA